MKSFPRIFPYQLIDEADFIIDNIWQENGDIGADKDLFNSKL